MNFDHAVVGYLAAGLFQCTECASQEVHTDVVRVFGINIRPYSQVCGACHRLVVDGYRKSSDGSPLSCFNGAWIGEAA